MEFIAIIIQFIYVFVYVVFFIHNGTIWNVNDSRRKIFLFFSNIYFHYLSTIFIVPCICPNKKIIITATEVRNPFRYGEFHEKEQTGLVEARNGQQNHLANSEWVNMIQTKKNCSPHFSSPKFDRKSLIKSIKPTWHQLGGWHTAQLVCEVIHTLAVDWPNKRHCGWEVVGTESIRQATRFRADFHAPSILDGSNSIEHSGTISQSSA